MNVGGFLEESDRCRDGDFEANVTAHCINRYGDSHQRETVVNLPVVMKVRVVKAQITRL